MKKNTFALLFLLFQLTAFAQTVWNGSADTTWYTSNQSTKEFTITTPQQLAGLAKLVNGSADNGTYNMNGKIIKLGASIMLNDTTDWQNWKETVPDNSFTAIGIPGGLFLGTFDGNNYVISGVYINNANNNQGLFGYVNGGTIKNVGIVASYIKGKDYIGGLVGYNSGGTVSNGYFTGTVSGTGNNVGGLVGYNGNNAIINSSYFTGNVSSGTSYVGGLTGYNINGTVSNSYSTGKVNGTGYVGGLIGYNSNGTVSNSYSTGKVSGSTNLGGLVGYNSGSTASNSFYDKESSGLTKSAGGTSRTTAEMKSEAFAHLLNMEAYSLSMEAWVYEEGEYPKLSGTAAKTVIASYFAEGEGTEKEPYIIKTKEQLKHLSVFVNAGGDFIGEYFKLGNDIALNDTANWKNWKTAPPEYFWAPIGTSSTNSFSGIFDGNGYVISGIYINNTTSSYQGLFGRLSSEGTIKNIGVVASYINCGNYVGALVGYNSGGTVSSSYSTGIVNGSGDIGGLVGYNSGMVNNSYSTGTVSGNDEVGGLVGWNSGGTVSNSYSTGTVIGNNEAGGLIGYNSNSGIVSNSYSTGMVSGTSYVGGLMGYNSGMVDNSYSTGTVIGTSNVGGLIGSGGTNGAVSNSYYDKENSGQPNSTYGIGKTTAEMKGESFTLRLNLEAYYISMNGWIYTIGEYPKLSSMPSVGEIDIASYFENKEGTETNPYIINTKEQLEYLSAFVNVGKQAFSGKYFKLGSDIALNDTVNWKNWGTNPLQYSWTPIGTSSSNSFNGTFDGNGHIISGIYINTSNSYQGLFGYNRGTIMNASIVASYINGNNYVGGLIGYNNYGTVINSYSAGIVSGTNYVGGITGYSNYGTVNNCYFIGNVSSVNGNVDAFVGSRISGTISNCYFESNEQLNSKYGLSKTAEEMKSESFVHLLNIGASTLSASGTNSWVYKEEEYPRLNSTPAGTITSYFASGEGKKEKPYIIKEKVHLENLSLFVNSGKDFEMEYFKLDNDIALNDTANWKSWETTAPEYSWTAIGNYKEYYYDNPFSGIFDGNGHIISGIYINTSSNYQGLFGNNEGTIRNVGIIASYIKGGNNVGGLAGMNEGWIINSYSTGTVSGSSSLGGLVGYNNDTVDNCYSTGKVNGTGITIGGLVGSRGSSGSTSNSYYDIESSGQPYNLVSYGIGKTTEEMQSENFTFLLNTIASTLVASGTNSWVYKEGEYPKLSNIHADEIDIASYFENKEGTETNPYIINTGKQLEYLSAFVNVGKQNFAGKYFKLGSDIALNDTTDWQNWGTTAPINKLTVIGTSSVNSFNGTFDGNSYVISGVYINNPNNFNGLNSYQGLFGYLGSGGTIKNVGIVASYINGNAYVGGLLGYNNGTVSNSYSTSTVEGMNNVGGLVGYNVGAVSNSYSAGEVNGKDNYNGTESYIANIGGLIGYNSNSGTVSKSYFIGEVSGSSHVGGLVGRSYSGTVSNCYSTGEVSGSNYVGGLIGELFSEGRVNNSYSTGKVNGTGNNLGGLVGHNYFSTVSNSYYDKITSLQTDTSTYRGIEKTTAEMKSGSTYIDWDFVDIWGINGEINNGYPYLRVIDIQEPARVISIAIKTQPSNLTYAHGDVLNLSGLVAILVYDDETTKEVPFANFAANNITTKPANGVKLSYDVHNGEPIEVIYNNSTTIKVTTNDLTVDEALITATEIGIITPVTGETPVTTVPTSGVNYTSSAVSWSPAVANKFLESTEYTATVVLTAKTGYSFTGLTNAKINGQTATIVSNNGTNLTLSYEFEPTDIPEPKAVISIAIKTQPGNLTYAHGDVLNLSGLVAILIYSDASTKNVAFEDFAANNITTNPVNGIELSYDVHDGEPIEVIYNSSTIKVITSDLNIEPVNSSSSSEGESSSSSGDETPIISQFTDMGSLRVIAVGNNLVFGNLPSNAKIAVYNIRGEKQGTTNLSKGLYLVKVNSHIFKVPVK